MQAISGRHAFSAIFGLLCKMGFLSHNAGSIQARRSIKGSKDMDDHLVSKKIEPKKRLIRLAPRARQSWSKIQKYPHLWCPPRIRRRFEQFSSYGGWRVMANMPVTKVAGAGVKGLSNFAITWYFKQFALRKVKMLGTTPVALNAILYMICIISSHIK